jgi:hypothetical protein
MRGVLVISEHESFRTVELVPYTRLSAKGPPDDMVRNNRN